MVARVIQTRKPVGKELHTYIRNNQDLIPNGEALSGKEKGSARPS
jgi:hypothetical protein